MKPNAKHADTGELLRVLGQPFRIEAQAYQGNEPLMWVAAVFSDGKVRPVPPDKAVPLGQRKVR